MRKAIKIIFNTSLFGTLILSVAILVFFLLYRLKNALGIDIFPDIHLKDILDNIF